ncbi:MAG: hypothetical protein J2P31_18455, partial [Blastocatellia bacterium]|nr:hypothetical protein [Blastocatellia bacterium]
MSSNTVGYACDTHASIATDGLAPGGWNDGGGSKIKGWDPWHGIRQQVVKRIARSFSCPAEFTLQVLGGKWK